MIRFFGTKPKIPRRIQYDSQGEYVILKYTGRSNLMKYFSLISSGYIYFLYHLDPSTKLGSYSTYTVPIFSIFTALCLNKFRRLVHKLVLLKGGQHVKFETYPITGWGRYAKKTVPIADIEGIVPYGMARWYNPLRIGRGYYKLKYEGSFLGKTLRKHVILRIPPDYDKDILKLVVIGKEVNEANLSMIQGHANK